jgi:hypothetical protein
VYPEGGSSGGGHPLEARLSAVLGAHTHQQVSSGGGHPLEARLSTVLGAHTHQHTYSEASVPVVTVSDSIDFNNFDIKLDNVLFLHNNIIWIHVLKFYQIMLRYVQTPQSI